MLQVAMLRESATKAFKALLCDRVTFLVVKAWVSTIDTKLEEINEAIKSARKLGATEVKEFTPEELKEVENDLKTLLSLEMRKEMREYLVDALVKKGTDKNIFAEK